MEFLTDDLKRIPEIKSDFIESSQGTQPQYRFMDIPNIYSPGTAQAQQPMPQTQASQRQVMQTFQIVEQADAPAMAQYSQYHHRTAPEESQDVDSKLKRVIKQEEQRVQRSIDTLEGQLHAIRETLVCICYTSSRYPYVY